MVSNIRYQHMGKWISTARRSKLRLLSLIAIFLFMIVEPEIGIAVIVNGYVLYGLISDVYARMRTKDRI